MALRASLFDDKILFFAIRSKILIPFSSCSDSILISGNSDPIPPFLNVSLAVCSAFFEALSP